MCFHSVAIVAIVALSDGGDFRARQMAAVFVLIKYRNRFSILAQTQAHTHIRRTISIYVWPSGYTNHQATLTTTK